MGVSPNNLPDKTCSRCGRRIEWRKKWAKDWSEVRFCSARCKKTKQGRVDEALEEAILNLLATRPRHATICPSEAARHVSPDAWRALMDRCRMAARRLVAQNVIDIVQRGRIVDPSTAKGPIRLRRRASSH